MPQIWPRNLVLPIDSGKIVTLMGVRRSGKTYLLFDLIDKLIKKGIPSKRIFYLNFEDERLKLNSRELDLIIQSYREIYPDNDLSECYFFFDEIQEVKGWEKFIIRLYNTISKQIFLTGSNASFLSKEIATALRGRTVTFEVYPLSFKEYLNVLSPGLNPLHSSDRAKVVSFFDRFLHLGGFPEMVDRKDNLHEKILQEYFNVMVFRDLIERYNISQASILKYFCKRVVANSACEFSSNKIYNEIKSQGYKVGKDAIYNYQNNVESIYLARFIPKYSYSIVKSELSQKKSYVIDQGLGVALDFKLNQDKGRLLETVVCLELLKQGSSISYIQNGTECDFLVVEKDKVTKAIQVAFDVSDEKTKGRELKGLIETCKKFELKEGYILTLDEEEELITKNLNIHIVPVWKYFTFDIL